MLDEVLGRVMTGVDGARCIVLAARDGVVVAARARNGAPSPELIAASMADLFEKVGSTFDREGLGAAAEVAVGGVDGHVMMRAVTPDYLLAIALAAGGSLGRARWELRRAAADLVAELS
ncbi:MAG TPA: roadblock/LC7 domain-containing protein [Candidatus Polarisedimenticolaceae bacterium]|nr:roadblock/LC7 domain-containing protein [Candidatus Polarisedimenticolaceae bacterium]